MKKIYEVETNYNSLTAEYENNIVILTSVRKNGMVEAVVLNEKDILAIAKKIKGEKQNDKRTI